MRPKHSVTRVGHLPTLSTYTNFTYLLIILCMRMHHRGNFIVPTFFYNLVTEQADVSPGVTR